MDSSITCIRLCIARMDRRMLESWVELLAMLHPLLVTAPVRSIVVDRLRGPLDRYWTTLTWLPLARVEVICSFEQTRPLEALEGRGSRVRMPLEKTLVICIAVPCFLRWRWNAELTDRLPRSVKLWRISIPLLLLETRWFRLRWHRLSRNLLDNEELAAFSMSIRTVRLELNWGFRWGMIGCVLLIRVKAPAVQVAPAILGTCENWSVLLVSTGPLLVSMANFTFTFVLTSLDTACRVAEILIRVIRSAKITSTSRLTTLSCIGPCMTVNAVCPYIPTSTTELLIGSVVTRVVLARMLL